MPSVFVDTAGWAASYPLARAAGATVIAYVHYPIVSTDMLARVGGGGGGGGRGCGAASAAARAARAAKAAAKAAYYYAIAALYGAAGGCAHGVAVNSGWTEGHINALWFRSSTTMRRLYPPCGVADLAALPIEGRGKNSTHTLVALAQFRPEKDHSTLLRALAAARAACGSAPPLPRHRRRAGHPAPAHRVGTRC